MSKYRVKVYFEGSRWTDDLFDLFRRYRVSLMKVEEDGSAFEVDESYVPAKFMIKSRANKLVKKQIRESKTGFIGAFDIEVK